MQQHVFNKHCERFNLVTWVRLKVDAEISLVAAPDGASYTRPWFLEAQVTRHIGTILDFILQWNEKTTIKWCISECSYML